METEPNHLENHRDLAKFDAELIGFLKEQKFIGAESQYEGIIAKSATADRIIFIKEPINNEQVTNGELKSVVKIFRDTGPAFQEEKKLIEDGTVENYIKMLKEYASEDPTHSDVPVLIDYKKTTTFQGRGIIIMSKARGKSLKKIFDDIETMDDKDIEKMCTKIGLQTGNITYLFYNKNEEKTIGHPDPFHFNYMYNRKKDQLYWIDLVGIHLSPYPSETNDATILSLANGLFLSYKEGGSDINVVEQKLLDNLENGQPDLAIRSIQKRLLAFGKIYEAYMQANGLINHESIMNHIKIQKNIFGRFLNPVMVKAVQSGYQGVLEELLKAGGNVNRPRGTDGSSLLHIAVRNNDAKMVKLLLQNGADKNADKNAVKNKGKEKPIVMTPLKVANAFGFEEIKELLK